MRGAKVRGKPILTKRQREILSFVESFIEGEGYAPTLEEIRDHLGLSAVSTVHEHVEKLIAKGYLSRGWNMSRSVWDTAGGGWGGGGRTIPLLGRVAAGNPIEAVPEQEEMSVPDSLAGKEETYALKVVGDSMVDEGILDGDTIVVEKAERAENGALVVALIGGSEAVVKRLYRRGEKVELVSANADNPPLVVDAAEVAIQGVVVGLVRKYR